MQLFHVLLRIFNIPQFSLRVGLIHGPNIYKDTKPEMSAFLKN
jgi:hypothetical protein